MRTGMRSAATLFTATLFAGWVAPVVFTTGARAATHEVSVSSFAFTPERLVIRAGDEVVWRNVAGVHNVTADDGSYNSGPAAAGWTFRRTFTNAGDSRYYCQPHGGRDGQGMSGVIEVQSATTANFVINEGVQGSWFNPATPGQGLFFDVAPGNALFGVAWFTWDSTTAGVRDWLTGAGTVVPGGADVTLFRTRNGVFNNPATVQTVTVGNGRVRFSNCSTGTFSYTLLDPPIVGSFAINRLLPASATCTSANPAAAGR